MRNAIFLMMLWMLTSCQNMNEQSKIEQTCQFTSAICQENYDTLSNGINKFDAAGGAFILINLENNEVLNSASISNLKDFNYNQDYSYTSKNIMRLLKEDKSVSTRQFITDYATFIKFATKLDLRKLRDNVLTGTARRINIDGINIYGLTATDYKLDNPDEVITTFLGHFNYQGQEYALITLLDSPKGMKSTFGFNSSGWNATELARKIIQNIVENYNL